MRVKYKKRLEKNSSKSKSLSHQVYLFVSRSPVCLSQLARYVMLLLNQVATSVTKRNRRGVSNDFKSS